MLYISSAVYRAARLKLVADEQKAQADLEHLYLTARHEEIGGGSAAEAMKAQEKKEKEELEQEEGEGSDNEKDTTEKAKAEETLTEVIEEEKETGGSKTLKDSTTRLFNRDELLELMTDLAKEALTTQERKEGKAATIGMVGYPNVGKSSTINVLMGCKKVSVAATPGKTKHFQTLKLNEEVTLCDCPGLVFPTFLSSKEDLVVNGIYPVDQLREFTAPVRKVCTYLCIHTLSPLSLSLSHTHTHLHVN